MYELDTRIVTVTRCPARGMVTLRMDGQQKILAGLTTPDEVLRVTQLDMG